jgi:hypothetical protein
MPGGERNVSSIWYRNCAARHGERRCIGSDEACAGPGVCGSREENAGHEDFEGTHGVLQGQRGVHESPLLDGGGSSQVDREASSSGARDTRESPGELSAGIQEL